MALSDGRGPCGGTGFFAFMGRVLPVAVVNIRATVRVLHATGRFAHKTASVSRFIFDN